MIRNRIASYVKILEFVINSILKLIHSISQAADDIITVDNIYKFVEAPRGPDVVTVNVESALNFGNRYSGSFNVGGSSESSKDKQNTSLGRIVESLTV